MSNTSRTNAAGDATRARILEEAWDLIVERGLGASMAEIAAAAEVTRQTVYFHFKSRAGLLIETARHRDSLEGIGGKFAEAFAAPTAREALEATIRTWFAYVPRILPVARALQNAAATDEDAAAAWWDRMNASRSIICRVVKRLADEGSLDDTWRVNEATDILWSITHVRAWDDLVVHRGWRPKRFIDRQVEVANRILLR